MTSSKPMKNLSNFVKQVLKIDPTLSDRLTPIADKWSKSRKLVYWKHLLKILNESFPKEHPQRPVLQALFAPKTSSKPLYTFEAPTSLETTVGTIPEHLEGRLRRNDRLQIELAKKAIEAKLTHNETLMVYVNKKGEKLEIDQKKAWYDLKQHFDLWKVVVPTSYFIRYKEPLLLLTSIKVSSLMGPGFGGPGLSSDTGLMKLDSESLKKFMKFLFPPLDGDLPPES